MLQVQNSLALGTSPVVRALFDPEGGMRDVRALDRVSFTDWFKSHGGSQGSIDRMWYAPPSILLCCGDSYLTVSNNLAPAASHISAHLLLEVQNLIVRAKHLPSHSIIRGGHEDM